MDDVDRGGAAHDEDRAGDEARDGRDVDRQLLRLAAQGESEAGLDLEHDDRHVGQGHPAQEQERAALKQPGQSARLAVARQRKRRQAGRGKHRQCVDGDVSRAIQQGERKRWVAQERHRGHDQAAGGQQQNQVEPSDGQPIAPFAQHVHAPMIGPPPRATAAIARRLRARTFREKA